MSPVLYQWINVIILVAVLGLLMSKKLGAHFASQRKDLDEKIKSAGAEHDRIQTKYKEIQAAIAATEARISDLKSTSLKEIELETRRIETETTRVLEKALVDSEARLKNEADRVKKSLEKELFQAALVQAKEQLKNESKSAQQEWLSQMVQSEAPEGKKNYAS